MTFKKSKFIFFYIYQFKNKNLDILEKFIFDFFFRVKKMIQKFKFFKIYNLF
jgi:hypothetical protein